jgi:hypothetical protein
MIEITRIDTRLGGTVEVHAIETDLFDRFPYISILPERAESGHSDGALSNIRDAVLENGFF